jgi:hypothetical protein
MEERERVVLEGGMEWQCWSCTAMLLLLQVKILYSFGGVQYDVFVQCEWDRVGIVVVDRLMYLSTDGSLLMICNDEQHNIQLDVWYCTILYCTVLYGATL